MYSYRGSSLPGHPALVTPRLFISRSDLDVMVRYAQLAPSNNEINGYALVTQRDEGTFLVEPSSVFITQQEVQPGHAQITPVGYLEAEERGFADGDDNRLRLQWHSHVWGQAVHSSTDLDTAGDYGRAGNVDWMFWLVLNRHGEALVRLEQYHPIRMGLPVELSVIAHVDSDRDAAMLAEIADKVTVVTPKRGAKRSKPLALFGPNREESA